MYSVEEGSSLAVPIADEEGANVALLKVVLVRLYRERRGRSITLQSTSLFFHDKGHLFTPTTVSLGEHWRSVPSVPV
jgi:hypothetical protein